MRRLLQNCWIGWGLNGQSCSESIQVPSSPYTRLFDFPEKVVALVCDGYARFSTTEREALLAHYLPPFEPTWDGSHLIWLLARMREQHLFFPWHDHSQPARLSYPSPAPAHLHDDVMHLLDAGDSYRTGYRAPFLYDDDATAAARLRCQLTFTTAQKTCWHPTCSACPCCRRM